MIRSSSADSSPLKTSVGPMTDTFLDRVCPIRGGEALVGLSLSSDFLNIAISFSAYAFEML
jgi:hypothetical protein